MVKFNLMSLSLIRLFENITPLVLTLKTFIKTLFISILFFSVDSFSSEYDLVLAGGALSTCSSLSPENCKSSVQFSDAKAAQFYEVSLSSLSRLASLANKFDIDIESQYSHLMNVYSSLGEVVLTKNRLFDALNGQGMSDDAIRALSDSQYFLMLDALEKAQFDEQGQRLIEKVQLNETTSPYSIDIYQRFIALAKQNTPEGQATKIGVVTASSRDAFEAADFYTGVFNQSEVEVVWLPLTAAFQGALNDENRGFAGCANLEAYQANQHLYDRKRLYPQRFERQNKYCKSPSELTNLIDSLDGLFFNGGDQSRTLAALQTPAGVASEFFLAIQSKLENGDIVIGGTSAGTAVQAGGFWENRPIPMLTSGHSRSALSRGIFYLPPPSVRCDDGACSDALLPGDITVAASGGTGIFNLGLTDTHFSERDRETRLVVATALTGQRLGFGVDETTALLVKLNNANPVFEVIGKAGVFVVDMQHGQLQQSNQDEEVNRTLGGLVSYWPNGTLARKEGKRIEVEFSPLASTAHIEFEEGQWRNASTALCKGKSEVNWQQFENRYVLRTSSESKTALFGSGLCGYHKVPFIITNTL